jgi:hypothetical protein
MYMGFYATAEAAARSHDRAVLALQQAGKAACVVLNFPKSEYAGEQLPAVTGAAYDCSCNCVGLVRPPVAACCQWGTG